VRIALLLLLATACQQSPKTDAPARSAAPIVAAPSASATPPRASLTGAWQGVYQAELFRIELPAGGVKEWKQDDGKKSSGEGKLSLQAEPDGSVTGNASGALGELLIVGHVDGDRMTLTLTPAQSDGFHGVILASQTPEGVKGTLSASTADSLQVRQASVTLTRADK
jgi:hypothetical protein